MHYVGYYKITKIVCALWLIERSVCTGVCKQGCGVKLFGFLHANHASTNLKKFSSSKFDKFTLFTHSFVGWNMENRYKEGESIIIFLRLSWHFKVSSRVKNHNFLKLAIFRWLNKANQELSFKKNSRKKCFFCADLWSAKVFSMLIILIDRWQVLSYLIRMSLLNQANHKYSTHCFSLDFGSECLQRRKKSLSVFVHHSKPKEDDKIVSRATRATTTIKKNG